MRFQKLIAFVLSGFIFLAGLPLLQTQATDLPGMMINNTAFMPEANPELYNGVPMVPAEEFAKSLGGSFTFNIRDLTGTVRVGENELVYHLDDSVVSFDGKLVQAAAPMKMIRYRFMIPAEFTAVKLGAEYRVHYMNKRPMIFMPTDGKLVYQVVSSDTLWIISQTFGVPISTIRQLNGLTSDMLAIGQKLVIKNLVPAAASIPAVTLSGATIMSGAGWNCSIVGYLGTNAAITVTGKTGDWYKVTTTKGKGYVFRTVAGFTQDLAFQTGGSSFDGNIPVDTSMDSLSTLNYTVVSGDSIWSVAMKYSIQDFELAAANNVSAYAVLYPGQVLKVPVHTIPVKKTLGPQYGEILDWFKEAQYVFPIGKTGKLTDMETGKSFLVKRTMGANHSDTETLTAQDSQIMKEIFGGSWIWTRRPFILEVDGRKLAVSVAGMPHGGVDGAPYLKTVDNRSDNYGTGPNYDAIAGNGMEGHFDLYFLNGIRHVDNTIDSSHQYYVLTAGGLR